MEFPPLKISNYPKNDHVFIFFWFAVISFSYKTEDELFDFLAYLELTKLFLRECLYKVEFYTWYESLCN